MLNVAHAEPNGPRKTIGHVELSQQTPGAVIGQTNETDPEAACLFFRYWPRQKKANQAKHKDRDREKMALGTHVEH
ncbi:MAG TPA: hypothetical protein VNT26_11570 [Candidatus Sulfotelmatobacter sp.]|nr:hypothetical protein [Candidatus Sulfotelmatobacter sp.]